MLVYQRVIGVSSNNDLERTPANFEKEYGSQQPRNMAWSLARLGLVNRSLLSSVQEPRRWHGWMAPQKCILSDKTGQSLRQT